MTQHLNPDHSTLGTGFLPFASGDLDRSGLRLTRAEFARFIGVSKQAVGEWVTSGKITLGADGRLDPRRAVSQLLRNTDPSRLRARVLAPLVKDIGGMQKRIGDLEAALAAAEENADFHESGVLEMIEQQDALRRGLVDERDDLELLPASKVISAIIAWLDHAASGEVGTVLGILECIPKNADEIPEDAPADAHDKDEKGGEAESILPTHGEIASLYEIDSLKDEVTDNE